MAERTLDARTATPAPAEAPAPAAAAGPSPLAAWLPLIVTIIAMPLLAFATTKFVLIPQMKQSLGKAGDAAPSTEKKDGTTDTDSKTKVLVPLSKILVNVAGTMGTRYLMASVTLVGSDESFRTQVEQNKDQLLDLATGTLCTKTISDLEKPGARNVIRSELMTVFNNALGGPVIKEIYITELAIQ